jgi:hypothetical protein
MAIGPRSGRYPDAARSAPGLRPSIALGRVLEPHDLAVANLPGVFAGVSSSAPLFALPVKRTATRTVSPSSLISSGMHWNWSKYSGTEANTLLATLLGPLKVPDGALPPPGSTLHPRVRRSKTGYRLPSEAQSFERAR